MDDKTARLLLENLLERKGKAGADVYLTTLEADALRLLLGLAPAAPVNEPSLEKTPEPSSEEQLTLDVPDPDDVDEDHLMCLDFGTSFSKAFACTTDELDDVPELIDLNFGNSQSGKPELLLPSELFIDEGEIYFGKAAREHFEAVEAPQERLIDSPKQFMTLGQDVSDLQKAALRGSQDPSGKLKQRDALVLFLAHLNARSEASLADKGLPANIRRRYAHPAWAEDLRERNGRSMRRIMAEAIALARTYGPELEDHMSLARAAAMTRAARAASDEGLPFVLVGDPVLEATAAGAGALIGTPETRREAYVILDIGAGTTDVAGCICVNDPRKDRVTVAEVTPAADATNQAGNLIDGALLKLIMHKSGLTSRTAEYDRVEAALRREIRPDKEVLFNQGSLTVNLVTGEPVIIELHELIETGIVRRLFHKMTELVTQAALKVCGDDKTVKLIATGGGARLPIVGQLDGKWLEADGDRVLIELEDALPPNVKETYPDFEEPYPQIAVAVGGALPTLPRQVNSVSDGIKDPGKKYLAPMYKS